MLRAIFTSFFILWNLCEALGGMDKRMPTLYFSWFSTVSRNINFNALKGNTKLENYDFKEVAHFCTQICISCYICSGNCFLPPSPPSWLDRCPADLVRVGPITTVYVRRGGFDTMTIQRSALWGRRWGLFILYYVSHIGCMSTQLRPEAFRSASNDNSSWKPKN